MTLGGARGGLGGMLPIERELRQEQGSSLLRISRRVEELLEKLQQSGLRAARLPASRRAAELTEHARLLAEYEQQRWYLLVQREAMGLHHHAIIDELYPPVAPLR